MFFPSKKKRLWRACVTQYAGSNAATTTTYGQQQQQPRHQHQHRPPRLMQPHHHQQQLNFNNQQQTSTLMSQALSCCTRCCCNASISESCNNDQSQPPPPPPPSSTNSILPSPAQLPHLTPYAYLNSCCFETYGENPSMMTIDSEVERQTDSESDNAMMTSERELDDAAAITNGCWYGSCTDKSPGDDYDHHRSKRSATTKVTAVSPIISRTSRRPSQEQCQRDGNILGIATPPATPPSPIGMTVASAVAATAVSVFRNCCGGGCLSTMSTDSSVSDSSLSHNHAITTSACTANNILSVSVPFTNSSRNNNNNSPNCCDDQTTTQFNDHPPFGVISASTTPPPPLPPTTTTQPFIPSQVVVNDPKDIFAALMKKLKAHQRATLLEAVENRFASSNGRHADCVLVQRDTIMGEEPNVIACRLWFWADLNDCSQLKRIPTCPNGKDRVYVCCNPTHWSRILTPETAPPPYQHSAMDRLKTEDRTPSETLKNSGNISITASFNTTSSSISSAKSNSYLQSSLRVQIPDSLTTDGEDHSTPPWCQVAYWELAQRVGDRYLAKQPSINIYSEGPECNSSGNSDGSGSSRNNDTTRCGEMCLKDLADKRQSVSPESVQRTRQKIGLGVTLSQEADGVWLYNRSAAPVFVHSPTLNDYDWWFHVSKVPPGYCLKAFDNHRARTQLVVCPRQIAGAQTGPIDTFSMRISFVKGWGPKYCRRDITACPCWLEVIFTRR